MKNLCDECFRTLSCPARELKLKAKELGIRLMAGTCAAFESQLKKGH